MGVILANVTKRDLILDIARSTGFTQSEIKKVVNGFFDIVSESLEEQKNIELRGFGTFYTKSRKARAARNPKTGDSVQLAETIAPLFKYSSDLKGLIEESHKLDNQEVSKDVELQPK